MEQNGVGKVAELDLVQLDKPYKVVLAEEGTLEGAELSNLVSSTRQVVAVNRRTGAGYCFNDTGDVVPCSTLPVIDVLDPDETMEQWLSTPSKRKRKRVLRALDRLAELARG